MNKDKGEKTMCCPVVQQVLNEVVQHYNRCWMHDEVV